MSTETANDAKLIFFCGKMGAGKSTLSRELESTSDAVRIAEDEWLAAHYAENIKSLKDYSHYAQLIKPFLKQHIQALLRSGVTVILDFPANTRQQRDWLVSLSNEIGRKHEMYYLDRKDETCLAQIDKRRQQEPARSGFDTPEMFHKVTAHFEAPSPRESLNILMHP